MAISSAQLAQMYRQSGQTIPKEFRDAEELRKHKYGARKKVIEGVTLASALEARAWRILKLWETTGAIQNLRLQPVYILQEKQSGMRAIKYVGDFQFWKDGKEVCLDTKGIETAAFRIKAKLFKARFQDVDLVIWNKDRVRELEGR